jgi:hypothetical protein
MFLRYVFSNGVIAGRLAVKHQANWSLSFSENTHWRPRSGETRSSHGQLDMRDQGRRGSVNDDLATVTNTAARGWVMRHGRRGVGR